MMARLEEFKDMMEKTKKLFEIKGEGEVKRKIGYIDPVAKQKQAI